MDVACVLTPQLISIPILMTAHRTTGVSMELLAMPNVRLELSGTPKEPDAIGQKTLIDRNVETMSVPTLSSDNFSLGPIHFSWFFST